MALHGFTSNTVIESAKVNANFQNLSDNHGFISLQWIFGGNLALETSKDYKSLPADVLFTRVDIVVDTAPVGAAIIVDIERSTDSGGSWTTIFTGGTNRPQIADGSRVGNTTTIDVPSGTGNSHLYRAKVSQIGVGTLGADLSVILKGQYTLD